jgi:hypothetical protein
LIEDGSRPSAVFACAFLCLTWNLMCPVDSTYGVCIKHLVWSQDAVGIRFSHTKNDQDGGSKDFKSQHCYTNHEDFALCCPITALFEYMTCFLEILQDTDGLLFPGSEQED